MSDVASAVGVSHQTVSRVLNGSPLVRDNTREQVLAAIRRMGYRRNNAARALVTNRSGRIGVITARMGFFGPSMVATALQEAAYEAGYEVAFVGLPEITGGALRTAVDRLLDQSTEAIILAVAHREALALARQVSPDIPLVLVEGGHSAEALSVGVDQEAGARLVTGYLLEMGHQSVAHIAGPSEWIESSTRRDGWIAAHVAAGKEPGPELPGTWSPQSGYEAGKKLASAAAEVTAVFAANDQMALGVLRAQWEAGRRVPDDISVAGFDDLPEAAYFWPPLTTVRQDFTELGRRAVDIALRVLGGEVRPSSKLIVPTLVERSSTSVPPPSLQDNIISRM